MPASRTVAEIGEFGLIDQVAARIGSPAAPVLLGPGDDAAVVATTDGRSVVSTDLLVEGVHFRRDWSTAADIGAKAAAQNLADIAAMGATPTALLVGLAMPGATEVAWVMDLLDGLVAEAGVVGAQVVGGDTVAAESVVLAVTAMGDLQGRPPVTRAGARPGDSVAVIGRLGHATAGLAVLSRGFRSPRVLVDAHRRPRPPYLAGPQAAVAGATAMCDVSDGLVADLGHIAAASGVAALVDPSRLIVDEPLLAAAAALGIDPVEWVLTGGDDHALVASFPAKAVPADWTVIGEITEGAGVAVTGVDLDAMSSRRGGYRHF